MICLMKSSVNTIGLTAIASGLPAELSSNVMVTAIKDQLTELVAGHTTSPDMSHIGLDFLDAHR